MGSLKKTRDCCVVTERRAGENTCIGAHGMQHTELHYHIGTDGSDMTNLGLTLPIVGLEGMACAPLYPPNTTRLKISFESTGSYIQSRKHTHFSSAPLGLAFSPA
jgi:hypothetical protein